MEIETSIKFIFMGFSQVFLVFFIISGAGWNECAKTTHGHLTGV